MLKKLEIAIEFGRKCLRDRIKAENLECDRILGKMEVRSHLGKMEMCDHIWGKMKVYDRFLGKDGSAIALLSLVSVYVITVITTELKKLLKT
ncbi:MAG: hypothetical protein U7127_20800 [Phormidium sp.]